MKRSITLFCTLFFILISLYAAAPTTQAIDIVLVTRVVNQIDISWTSGNGANRIVVAKAGAGPVDNPVNGTDYTPGAFGSGGSQIGATGSYVVAEYVGAGTTASITGLVAGTIYTIKVFEYNGTGVSTEYMTANGATGNPLTTTTLATAPSNQPSSMLFSNVTPTSMDVGYTAASGGATGYIAVSKSLTSPTGGTPTDGQTYSLGDPIGDGTVVFIGGALTFSNPLLTAATVYHYDIYSYNGSGASINYLTGTPLENSRSTLSIEPTGQSTDVIFSSVGNTTMTVDWTQAAAGAGNLMLVVGKAGSAPTLPTDGTTYTANLAFGSGGATDGGASRVVYKGASDGAISITGLNADTQYFFRVFEFNRTANGDENYNTASGSNNDGTQSQPTSNEPSNQVTSPLTPFANIGATTMRVSWSAATAGALAPTHYLINAINKTAGGAYKPVNDGGTVNNDTDLTIATGSSDGAQNIAFGTNLYNWTGLEAGQEYEFRIYSYRTPSVGIAFDPDFKLTSPPTISAFTEPAAQASLSLGGETSSSIDVTIGSVASSSGVILSRRKTSAVAGGPPVDGNTSYTVGGTLPSSGSNEVIVYIGPAGTVFNDTGLSANNTYHYKLYTFSGTGSKTNYLTASPTTASTTTPGAAAKTSLAAAAGFEPGSFSSTITTLGAAVLNFDFTVTDDGITPAADNNKTLITGITIKRKDLVTGDIDDWSAVLDGAELSDNNGTPNTQSVSAGANITANSIIFSGINTGNEQLGELDDNETKIYRLKVWLKPNLGSTTIDGANFVFFVDNASFTVDPAESLMDPTNTSIESGDANNVVTVVANKFVVAQQPSSSANATVALAQQPIFHATDANNNRDLGFNTAISAVNTGAPGNLAPVFSATTFASGVASFTDLRFNNTGNSTMTITAGITSGTTNSITVTAATTLAGGTTGTAPGPNINDGSTNQAVLGFSLQTTGSALNFTAVNFTTTSDPDVVFNNIRIFSSTTPNFGSATNLGLPAPTTPGNTINFTGFTTPISGTLTYFFVVADVNSSFSVSNPTIQLSLTTANTSVSAGAVVGSTQTGTLYAFVDATPPTIVSITNNVNPIYESALTQTVVVRFSESMNSTGAFNPAIALTGANWGAQAAGSWSMTTFSNDTYTTTFTHTATQETIPAATATISANTARDLAGNSITNAPQSSASFLIDNQKPTASVTLSSGAINTNSASIILTVTYNEPMNNTLFPTITFSPANANLSAPAPTTANWNLAKTVFTITYTHNLNPETIASITARANGAFDANGNVQTALATSPAFAIDTQRPTAAIVYNDLDGFVRAGQSLTITANFSEPIADAPIVRIALSGANTVGATNMTKVSATQYTYNHAVTAGNGVVTIALSIGTDIAGNLVVPTPTGGATIIADDIPPTLSSLSPPDNSFNRQVGENLLIALSDANTGVQKNTGTISLFMAGGSLVETFDVATSPLLTISPSNTLVINPTADLLQATSYYVIIPAGAITDLAGNPFAGFALDTNWNFVTFGPPIISSVAPLAGTAVCIGTDVVITGSFLTGVTEVRFNGAAGLLGTNLNVVSDTEVRATAPINAQPGPIYVRKAPFGTNPDVNTTSIQTVLIGPSSAALSVGTINNMTVCTSGTIITSTVKINVTGGVSPFSATYRVTPGAMAPINNLVPSYTSGADIVIDPPGTGLNNVYTIFSVQDANGCFVPSGPPIGDQRSGSYSVFENQRPTVDAGGPALPPFNYCLANGNNIVLNAATLGTAPSMSGAGGVTWTRNGSGTFSNANILQPTYTISSFDILNNNLQLTLTTTSNPTACDAAVDVLPINFVSNSTANPGGSGGVYNYCWNGTPNPVVQLSGSIAGGATGYQWNSISGLNAQFSSTTLPNPTYTFNATENANGFANIELTPTGGTCGGPGSASPLRINLNPVPTNSFISPKTNVCVGETVTYKLTSTPGNSYSWTVPNTGGTTFENNGNSINVIWGNTTGQYQISAIETRGADGCQSASIDLPINLNEEPVPAFTSPNARIFGNQANPVLLTGSGDVNNGATSFSGAGVFINGSGQWMFSPSNAGVGNNYPIRYTYQSTATGCSNFKEELFTVFDGDESIVLYPSGANLPDFCADEDEVEIKLNPAIAALMPTDQSILVGYDITYSCTPPPFVFCFPNFTPIFQNVTYQFAGFTGLGITANTMGAAPRNTDGRAFFDPELVVVGGTATNLDLVYYYQESIDGSPNGPPKEFGRQTITINPVPTLAPNFAAIQNTLCSNNASINLTKNDTNNPGTDFTFFVSPAISTLYPGIISGNAISGFTLNPSAFSSATYDASFIDLFYGYQDNKGCNDTTSVAASNTYRISLTTQPPAPTIDIGTNICITSGAVPVATMTNVVANSVANANTRWFNNVNLNPPTLSQNPDFLAPINPAINNTFDFYAVQEINGCISPVTQLGYEVLNVPKFTWDKFCVDPAGTDIKFDVNLGSVNATDLTWTVLKSDATTETSQTSTGAITGPQSFTYNFMSSDRFDVTADVTSINGCVSSRTQPVILLNKYTATDTQIYSEDFEGGRGGFIALKDDGSPSASTWDYGVINKTRIKNPLNNSNNKGWVTNLTGSYNNGERSYLYSGCLDISGLQRPLISFSSWTNTDDKNDGVILQYSIDNKVINDPAKAWDALGNIGTGLAWYNRQLIQSIPGDKPTQNYGWSGNFDKGWQSSKHSLDAVANELQNAGATNVVFRFAFAATNPPNIIKTLDGFAIDSVFIGNRTRTILLENFTNKGNLNNAAQEANQSSTINAFNPGGIGTTLVKINYHVGFPNEDPFNIDNPADPSARALYYNVTNTPSARLDGDKPDGDEQPFSQWGPQEYSLRTLQLGQSEIGITTSNNVDGSISVMVEVTPNTNLPQGTRLHVAILEEQINKADLPPLRQNLVKTGENSFEYVLKKMLPSAPGFDTGPLAVGILKSFGPFVWYPEPSKLYKQPNDLAVVAFLQDEQSKHIYQAEVVRGISDPPIVTGLDDILNFQKIEVFPNPANHELTIQLPNAAPSKINIQMVDQVGRTVYNHYFEQGEQSKTIDTSDMAGGVYLIQLGSGKVSTRQKIMVVHK